jgi:hypothetical protein
MPREQITPDPTSSRISLEKELQKALHDSLVAARQGDYRKLAQKTAEATRLHHALSTEPEFAPSFGRR